MICPTTLLKIPLGSNFSRTAANLWRCYNVGCETECLSNFKITYPWIEILNRLRQYISRILCPMRPARKLVYQSRTQIVVCESQYTNGTCHCESKKLTKWFIESQVVSPSRSVAREVEHYGALGPVGAICCIGPHLAQQIVVGSPELDVDSTTISARHGNSLR
jgi:hypothetical protein